MQVLTAINSEIRARLTELWERTGDPALHRLSVGGQLVGPLDELRDFDPDDADAIEKADPESPEYRDWISTALMNCYRNTGDPHVFGLLYELNEASFSEAIRSRLRRTASSVDGGDVLHEVFLNIYRYPHRFLADRPESFRNWGHRIVRNTLLKALKREGRYSRMLALDEELEVRPDSDVRAPDRRAENAEIAKVVDRAYLLYLNVYWLHFQRLSAKERRALTMVEIEGASYREAATELGIRLENLKMVVFRGRRKVLRNMRRSLALFDRI
ncbi:MAG: RNA polymerase sigma factor [Planctomycetes bacterium]|nr:RNA polymerase sigma factor [Planctomycetota bacterium]